MQKKGTIRIVNLTTGYKNKHNTDIITRDINASLYSNELTCLLGPNGAGKSTLLKTLTAFLSPISGVIMIEGKPIQDYSELDLAKMIGVVLTERLNINNMTVEELVGMGRSPYTGFWGHLKAEDKAAVDEAISLVGINSFRGRMIQTLSDGERQKVMIAKALAQETPVIFLDEPTAFLDYPSKVEIMQILQNLSKEKNKTIFLSTHDLELALQIADKIWLIDQTHGLTIGNPEDLALSGELNKYFQREGIYFDIDSGLFKIDHKIVYSVNLKGDGPLAAMVKKALTRNGIGISNNDDSEISIVADKSSLMLNGVAFPTILDLVEATKQLIANSVFQHL